MTVALSSSQQRIYDYLVSFLEKNGYPPAYSDIASQFGFKSDGTVRTYLDILEKKGYISRAGHARGIKILKFPEQKVIPIVGKIAAGTPVLAEENIVGSITDLRELSPREGRFALTVSGDSMKNAGILDGDIAVIQKGVEIRNGQIAAVMLDNHATLKRIYFEDDSVRLEPENPDYSPIIISRRSFDVHIIGRYIALIRKA